MEPNSISETKHFNTSHGIILNCDFYYYIYYRLYKYLCSLKLSHFSESEEK